ncbi:MAG: DUF502 domain-containing protein [Chloroflexota bacterium]
MPTKKQRQPSRWLQHIRNVFLTGIVAVVPLVVTYLVFRWLFDAIDGMFQPLIKLLIGRTIPGVGLVVVIILVYLVGLIATNVVGRRLVQGFDAVISRTPIIQYVYAAAREVVNALRGLRRVSFKEVVVVEFPKAGMYSLGFITGHPLDFRGQKKVPVFVPHTPNPMTGFLVMLAAEDIIDTDLTIEEAMRMILSGGLLTPEEIMRTTTHDTHE